MKYIIAIAGIVIFLSSCVTSKRCNDKFPPETRIKDSVVLRDSTHIIDSIRHVTITKDSVVYTKAVKDSGEIDVNQGGSYKFNNGVVQVELNIKEGKAKWKVNVASTQSRFVHTLDSLASVIEVYKAKDSINSHEIEAIKEKPIEPKKWYAGILQWIKNGLAIIAILWLIVFIFVKGSG